MSFFLPSGKQPCPFCCPQISFLLTLWRENVLFSTLKYPFLTSTAPRCSLLPPLPSPVPSPSSLLLALYDSHFFFFQILVQPTCCSSWEKTWSYFCRGVSLPVFKASLPGDSLLLFPDPLYLSQLKCTRSRGKRCSLSLFLGPGSADMLFILIEKLKLFLQRHVFSSVQGISSRWFAVSSSMKCPWFSRHAVHLERQVEV